MQYKTLHSYTYISIMPSSLGLYTTLLSNLMNIGAIVIYICSHSNSNIIQQFNNCILSIDFLLKGPIPSPKKDKTGNQRVITLRINSACESIRYRTPNLSLGAPLFIMCLCLQSRNDVSCSSISLSRPGRYLVKNIYKIACTVMSCN